MKRYLYKIKLKSGGYFPKTFESDDPNLGDPFIKLAERGFGGLRVGEYVVDIEDRQSEIQTAEVKKQTKAAAKEKMKKWNGFGNPTKQDFIDLLTALGLKE